MKIKNRSNRYDIIDLVLDLSSVMKKLSNTESRLKKRCLEKNFYFKK